MRLGAQVAMFVEKGGETLLAHWTEVPLDARTRTHLAVFGYERTLIPRDRVAMALRESQYDLDLPAARAWLARAGYRIVGELPAGT